MAGRRGRSLLLVLAVALATALIVAVASAMGTVGASLRQVMTNVAGGADLRLQHRYGGRIDEAFLHELRGWPAVEAASATLETSGTLRAAEGRRQAVVVQGVTLDAHARIAPMRLTEGRELAAPGEVVIDAGVREALRVAVGDEVTLSPGTGGGLAGLADRMLGGRPPQDAAPGGQPLTLRVVGVLDRPRLRILQRPTAWIALGDAQALANRPGQLTAIDVKVHDDAEAADLERQHAAEFPPGVEVRATAAGSAGMARGMRAARVMLLIITLLVFISAGFIIMTSLTTAVVERLRELAVLRCIGASRTQMATGQVLVGLLVAGAGAALGAPLGVLLAYVLYRRYSDALIAGFAPDWAGVAAGVGAALLAGLLGAAYPAVRATRVRPLEALAVRARQPRPAGLLACLLGGMLCAAAQPLVLALPLDEQSALRFYMAVGLPLTFVGWFLLSVPLLVVLAWVAVPAVSWLLRLPPSLLGPAVRATPYRHGFTGGALMVGLSLLVAIWTGGRSAMGDWFDRVTMPDGFVAKPALLGLIPLTDEEYEALQAIPGVAMVSPVAAFPVETREAGFGLREFAPTATLYVSFEPQTFLAMTRLDWIQGNPDDALTRLAEGRALLVSREYLLAHALGVGDSLTLETLDGPVDFEIAGVIGSPGLDVAVQYFGLHRYYADAAASSVFGTRADAARYFGIDQRNLMLLKFEPWADDRAVVRAALEAVPGSIADSARHIRRNIEGATTRLMKVASTVAVASLLIACFGVGSLIIANIASRRFEYGVLRAVGAQRWLLGRMILAETLLIALVGCVGGAALGVQLAMIGRVFHYRLLGLSYALRLPWDVIVQGSLAVTALALLAALPAAWRLAREHPRALLAGE